MCKSKPGRRCPKCRGRAVTSQARAVAALKERLDSADPGTDAFAQLVRERDTATRELVMRHADYASTAEARERFADELEQRLAKNPRDPEIPALARKLVEGRLMDAYRRDQMALMPDAPTHPAARQAHKDLGDARFDMSRFQLRMDLNGADTGEWEHWNRRHFEAAQRANIAAARMQTIEEAGSADAWAELSAAERLTARKALADNGTFSTPIAPRTIEDVLQDYADRAEGHDPIPDDLARHARLPFTEHESRTLAGTEPEAGASDDAVEPAAEATQRATERARTSQNRRRRSRRGSAKRFAAQVRRRSQKVSADRMLGTVNKAGLLKEDDEQGAMVDPTGIMFLLELWPRK